MKMKKIKHETGAVIWRNESGSFWWQRGGMIYTWMLDIGRFSITWERKRVKR